MLNPILGIDTWEGQLEIDEAVLKANGVAFMFIRLNDMNGGHHKDSGFDKQWNEAKNFHRAPYFVYNPWVSGSVNYLWLQANMPAEAKAVAIDIEVTYAGYPNASYAAEVKKFIALVRAKWNYVIYTGEWFLSYLSTWDTTAFYWWAQYPNEFHPTNDLQLTWDELRTRLKNYTMPSNLNKVPGTLLFWQFSGDRLILPGNAREMDVNVFYGSESALQEFMGGVTVSTDTITTPFDAVRSITGTRFGCKFYLDICDPKKVRFEVRHAETADLRELPSVIAKRFHAQMAWNGDDWDKNTSPYLPKGCAVSNGQTYIVRNSFVPSLIFFKDGTVIIDHVNHTGQWNVTSGLRYLVSNGQVEISLDGKTLEYTERHARSINGIDKNGQVMHLTMDGFGTGEIGVTLKEAALLMLEFGAVKAFDAGGGGDSDRVINGVVTNIPADRTPEGQPAERRVPQFLLAYPQGANPMPTPTDTDHYEYTATGNRAIRTGPGATYPRIANSGTDSFFNIGTIAKGGADVSDRVVLDGATAILVQGLVGDIWVKVYDNNGHAVDGWTAKIHKGQPQLTEVFVPAITPPETTPLPDLPVSITLGDDVTYTKQTVNVTLKPK